MAQAAATHEFLPGPSANISKGVPTVGPHGETVRVPGPLGEVQSMTVDSGELYVAEGVQSSRIDTFNDTTGAFSFQFPQLSALTFLHQGVTVGHSTGEAQVFLAGDEPGTHNGVVAVLSQTGNLKGEWRGTDTPSKGFGCFECEAPGAIAVDGNLSSLTDWAAGDVYVADLQNKVVDVFKPLAGGGEEYVTQLQGPEPPGGLFSEPVRVAVNPLNGEVVVSDRKSQSEENVDIFKPAVITGQYEFVGKLAGPLPGGAFGPIQAIAMDGGDGDIYVVDGQADVVDQYDSEGKFLGLLRGTPSSPSGEVRPFNSVRSVAVDAITGDVYVGDFNQAQQTGTVDVFGKSIVVPDVTTGAVSGVDVADDGRIEATLNGTVNQDKEGEASCRFVWGSTRALGQVAPCEPEKVAESSSPVAVHAKLGVPGTLAPDTTYFYRLQASNKNGTNPGEGSQDMEFTTPGPGLHGESVADIAATSATLGATVNPHAEPTSYYFQYGTNSEYEAASPAAPGLSLGSGEGDVQVSPRHIQGLLPATLYHYRVVAVSELEVKPGEVVAVSFAGPDQTFRTQSAGGALSLLDGRRWELVSPPDKHGSTFGTISESGLTQASASGGALTYISSSPTEEGVKGYLYGDLQIMSTRGGDGWSSQNISLPHGAATGLTLSFGGEYRFFSPDLSHALIEPFAEFTSLAPESFPPDSESTLYVRHDSTCASTPDTCFQPLVTGAPGYANVPEGVKFGGRLTFLGASEDLAHAIFSSPVSLTSTPTGGRGELYEFSAAKPASDELQLVSLLPADEKGEEKPAQSPELGFKSELAKHAISGDGSRVVWSDKGHLYLRDMTLGKTVQLDIPESECLSNKECGAGEVTPVFQLASQDGSRVLFTDRQRLSKDSGRTPEKNDLYECTIVVNSGEPRCELSDLTPAPGPEEGAEVQGTIIGASEDGSWVYFVANGVLGDGTETGAAPGGCNSEKGEGSCNLYVYHGGVTHLVAVVSGEDYPDWNGGLGGLNDLTARVSPDGRWLAFMSDRSLTGYDNHDAVSGHPDEEVFVYHAEPSGSGRLVCASCDPTGARPVGVEYEKLGLVKGDRVWPRGAWIAANVPGWTPYKVNHALHQSRYLSDEGRLFFNSSDALVAQDINHNQDVYEYEPVDVGGCSDTFVVGAGGCVGLVSSGQALGESAFLDASESGDDVFFLTGEQLVSGDVDTSVDVYDAHTCSTGVPCLSEPVAPPECTTAESCRAAPLPQPAAFGAPASATFSGAGNVSATGAKPVVRTRSLSRAQRLSKALSVCRRKDKREKGRRKECEQQAHKRYGPVGKARKGNLSAKKRSGR
jgi:hypothetical protein